MYHHNNAEICTIRKTLRAQMCKRMNSKEKQGKKALAIVTAKRKGIRKEKLYVIHFTKRNLEKI